MAHVRRGRCPQSIVKRMIPLLISLDFIFSFSAFMPANPGYKIISYKGTIKIKQHDEVSRLEKQPAIDLQKGDAVMVYPGAEIAVMLPGGEKKTITGPFYATVESLENPPVKERLSFFAGPSQWKGIERIFEEEGEESAGTTKGTQEDSLNFYNEINQGVAAVKIEDKTLSPDKEKEMKEILETAASGFNAFPEEKQIVIRSLVYKNFGRYKTALDTLFAHYKGILYTNGKQAERELLEDYLFNQFLPIAVTIHSPFSFSANFKLWWAAFYFDGEDLRPLDKTIDYSMHPQNEYKLKDNPAFRPGTQSKGKSDGNTRCVFIVACADWEELEKLDNLETARKEFLDNRIKETKPGTIQDYGSVIIKISL
jgi:hypothetical protein